MFWKKEQKESEPQKAEKINGIDDYIRIRLDGQIDWYDKKAAEA